MKLKRVYLHQLHNDEYWQFITRLNDHIKAAGAVALKIEVLYAAFVVLYAQLDAAYKKILKSALSADIDVLDRDRDETYRGIKDLVAAALRHFKPELKAAANRVHILLDGYGDVTQIGKSAQTAATTNLLGDMVSKYAADVEMLDLMPWVTELDRLNVAIERLMETRFDETTARTDLSMREVRLAMDRVYGDIVFRVEALQEVMGGEPDSPWAAFIEAMNTIIEYTDNIVAMRKGKAATKQHGEAGKPATTAEPE